MQVANIIVSVWVLHIMGRHIHYSLATHEARWSVEIPSSYELNFHRECNFV